MRPAPLSPAVCWLAAFGLTCLASTVVLRRRTPALTLLDRLGRCADDIEVRAYA